MCYQFVGGVPCYATRDTEEDFIVFRHVTANWYIGCIGLSSIL